jgi:hypothetical protein
MKTSRFFSLSKPKPENQILPAEPFKERTNFLPAPKFLSHSSANIPMPLMKASFLRHIPSVLMACASLILSACADQGYGPGPGPGSGHIQGHMVNALQYLNAANNDLNQASHDKGGHRVNAMQLINQAINEVNAGIAVGESHGD